MFMNKKAVDLTINTVVVAILAVLVLVVLFYVFTGKVGSFSQQLQACPSGDCMMSEACTKLGGSPMPGTGDKYLMADRTPCSLNSVCCTVAKQP